MSLGIHKKWRGAWWCILIGRVSSQLTNESKHTQEIFDLFQSFLGMPAVSPNINEQSNVMDLNNLSWDEVQKVAKLTENEIDNKLLTLGRMTSHALRHHRNMDPLTLTPSLKEAESITEDISSLLTKLSSFVDELGKRGDEMGGASSSHILQRHKDLLVEYSTEFRKTRVNFNNNFITLI